MTDSGTPAAGNAGEAAGGWAGQLGARITRDAAVYTAGRVIAFVLALVNVAVVTRFLDPTEFGQLALLLFLAAMLTILYNLGLLQGTFMAAFGAAGDEDMDDDDDRPMARDPRRAVGTGLVTTVVIGAVGTGIVALLAPEIADLLLGDRADGDLVLIAAASGALGALWRLGSNVLRLERRPHAFVALSAARPILVVSVVVPLVAGGGGVGGAISGTAIGGAVAVLVMLAFTWSSFKVSFGTAELRMIMRRGALFVPVAVSFWVAQNVDLLALSRYTPDDQVGLYRLAGRIGAFLSYFTAALFMAWTPLVRTSTFVAAERERGRDVIGGTLITYFVLGGMLLLLGMTVTADGLVRIAPPAYADAAPLVPLLAGAFLAHGLLVAVYRVSSFPRKRTAYIGAAAASALVFLGLALVLIPWLGASGAALSVIAGFLAGVVEMAWLSQHGPKPLHMEYGRIAAGLGLAALCLLLARAVGPLAGSAQPAVELIALILYPVLLIATNVIAPEERRAIMAAARGIVLRPRADAPLVQGIRDLSPQEHAGLELTVARGWSLDELAGVAGSNKSETSALLVGAVRRAASLGEPTQDDARIGEYLFGGAGVAESDAAAKRLWSDGIDPGDLHRLEGALAAMRRLSKRAWQETADRRHQDDPRIGAGRR